MTPLSQEVLADWLKENVFVADERLPDVIAFIFAELLDDVDDGEGFVTLDRGFGARILQGLEDRGYYVVAPKVMAYLRGE